MLHGGSPFGDIASRYEPMVSHVAPSSPSDGNLKTGPGVAIVGHPQNFVGL